MSKFYHLRIFEKPDLRTDCIVDQKQFLVYEREEIKSWQYFEVLGISAL